MGYDINIIGLWTIFRRELHRTRQVMLQAVLSPTISTVLYFVVFGAAMGTNIQISESIHYGNFIVPGLIMMALITNALSAASSGIYFPRFTGTIVDLITAPISHIEIILGYALGATVRATLIGTLVYIASILFIFTPIAHPFLAILFILLSSFAFSLLGVLVGIWAKDFEQLSLFPMLVVMPLSFLGGVFYSIDMLPPAWKIATLINPIYYMVDGLRYAMIDTATTNPFISLATLVGITFILWFVLANMFSRGYGMRT